MLKWTSYLDDEGEDEDDKGRLPDMPMSAGPVQNALFKSRTVLIFGEIDMRLAERVTAQITALASESDKPIRVIINSPGGHVESGDTIHDMIRFCGAQVKVIGTGWVASAVIWAVTRSASRISISPKISTVRDLNSAFWTGPALIGMSGRRPLSSSSSPSSSR